MQIIPIWIHPGSNAAPPNNVSVSGLDATQIQGVPVSPTPPSQGQALVFNAGQWEPISLTTMTGDLITGDGVGNPTLLRAGGLGQVLTVGPGNVLQWSSVSGSPTGPAGFNLNGTYPNPGVVGLYDVANPSVLRPVNGNPRFVGSVLTFITDPDTGTFGWNAQSPNLSPQRSALGADQVLGTTPFAVLAVAGLVGHSYLVVANCTFQTGGSQEIANAWLTDNVNPVSNSGGAVTLSPGNFWGTVTMCQIWTPTTGATGLALTVQSTLAGVTVKATNQIGALGATTITSIQVT